GPAAAFDEAVADEAVHGGEHTPLRDVGRARQTHDSGRAALPKDVEDTAARLSVGSGEAGLSRTRRTGNDGATGTAGGRERTGAAARDRPAHLPAQIHDGLVPRPGVATIEQTECGVVSPFVVTHRQARDDTTDVHIHRDDR